LLPDILLIFYNIDQSVKMAQIISCGTGVFSMLLKLVITEIVCLCAFLPQELH